MEHRLNIEEIVEQLNNDNLAQDDNAYNSLKSRALLKFEVTIVSLIWAGIEHIPEMSPNEYWEQQCLLISCHSITFS